MRSRLLPCLSAFLTMCFIGTGALAQRQTFAVAGRMIDEATGRPLARATVNIAAVTPEEDSLPPRRDGPSGGDTLGETTTGSDGSFRFSGLAAGRYHLSASRRGYLPASFEEHGGFFAAVIVGEGDSAAVGANHLRFPLLPLASIRGTILDSSGDPVQSATVQLFMQGLDGSGAIRQRGATSLQRGSSSYEFSDLAPGNYYVAVTARPWFAESGQTEADTANPLDVAYAPAFFENASTAAAAQPISLQAGETAQANFSLHAVPAVHVQVAAQRETGFFSLPQLSTPAFDGQLSVGIGVVSSREPREGGTSTLSMSVAPGAYFVQGAAGISGDNPVQISADTTLDNPGADTVPVAISGRLAMADGSSLPGNLAFRLSPNLASPGGRVGSLIVRQGSQGRTLGGARTLELKVNADGSFSSDAVPPGDYRMSVRGAEGAAVLTGAAASGGKITDDLQLQVGSDPIILAGTLVLADRDVSGVVVAADGSRASGVMVVLLPETPAGQPQPAPSLYQQQESDSDGTWTIRGVAPGKYKALAIQDGWDLAWRKREAMERYAAGAVTVEVTSPGSTALRTPLVAQQR